VEQAKKTTEFTLDKDADSLLDLILDYADTLQDAT
jgi:hypothetical protein